MVLNSEFKYTSTNKESLSVYGVQHKTTQTPLVALWLDGQIASNSFKTTQVSIKVENGNFKKPDWVDLMIGSIYEIPKSLESEMVLIIISELLTSRKLKLVR